MSESLPLLKGTLDLLVLKALSCEPNHGYGVSCWLEAHSRGSLGIDDSALYQALRRLEHRGFLDAEWGTSENNRRARFYRLTHKGEAELAAQSETWSRYARSVADILGVGG